MVSGRGEVHSFTVNHQPWDGDPEPYAIVIVAFPEQEGLRLTPRFSVQSDFVMHSILENATIYELDAKLFGITDPAAMNISALKKAWVMRWNMPAP